MSVLGDVAFELVAEAVGALEHGRLPRHPERSAQSGIAILRDPASAAELPIEAPSVQARWATPDCTVARSMPQNFRNWR